MYIVLENEEKIELQAQDVGDQVVYVGYDSEYKRQYWLEVIHLHQDEVQPVETQPSHQ